MQIFERSQLKTCVHQITTFASGIVGLMRMDIYQYSYFGNNSFYPKTVATFKNLNLMV